MMPTTCTYEAIVFNASSVENVPQAASILMHRAVDTAVLTLDRILGQGLDALTPRSKPGASTKAFDESRVEIRVASKDTSSVVLCEASRKKNINHVIIFNLFFTTAFEDDDMIQENRVTYLHIVKGIRELVSTLIPGAFTYKSTKSAKPDKDSSLDAPENVGHVRKEKGLKNGDAGGDWEFSRLGGCLMPCDLPNRPYQNLLLLMVMEDHTQAPKAENYTLYEVPDHFIAQQIKDITVWVAARDAGDDAGPIPLAAVPQVKVHSSPAAPTGSTKRAGPSSSSQAAKKPRTPSMSVAKASASPSSKASAKAIAKPTTRSTSKSVLAGVGAESEGEPRVRKGQAYPHECEEDEDKDEGTISGDDAESGPDDEEYELLVEMGLALTAEQGELRKLGWRF